MKVFLTNLPNFYKVSLYNEVNKQTPLYVIFTNKGADGRNKDFYSGDIAFPYTILKGGLFHRYSTIYRILRDNNPSEFILGGWESYEEYLGACISPRKRNSLIVESSVYESQTTGFKALIKKVFLKRISKVYAAGILQKKLVDNLSFTGEVVKSGGCGLLNYMPQPPLEKKNKVKSFLYVGRLVEVKNLELLIRVFNSLPDLNLTIIGFGIEEGRLRSMANNNTHFLGAVPNKDLSFYYRSLDAFILPSKSEPWGLVVEEALNNGMPVIVSDRVGCMEDLVSDVTGLVFVYNSYDSLRDAVLKMTDIDAYNKLRAGVAKLDFLDRARRQIDCFI